MPQSVYAVATMDTKGHELAFVAECLRAAGVPVVTGRRGVHERTSRGRPTSIVPRLAGVSSDRRAARSAALAPGDRSPAICAMSVALDCFLRCEHEAGRLAGVIGIGGSGGTALITPAMRAFRLGCPRSWSRPSPAAIPRRMSASSDITLVYSVVDVAGLNSVSRKVLGNAAAAMAGMVRYPVPPVAGKPDPGNDDVRRDDPVRHHGARIARSAAGSTAWFSTPRERAARRWRNWSRPA